MKLPYITVAILATSLLAEGSFAAKEQAGKGRRRSNRVARQTSADQMVQNILKWLQGVYTQQSRRSRFADYHSLFNFASDKLDDAFRQGTLREYLPPTNTQKPRPFETAKPPGSDEIHQNGNYIYGGYPPAGSITPQPPFPIFTRPAPGGVTGEHPSTIGYPQTIFPGQSTPLKPTGFPIVSIGTAGPAGYPTPGFPTHAPETPPLGGFTGYPSGHPSPGDFTGYPGGQTTPGDFTGYPDGKTTPGDFIGRPGEKTTPGDFTGYPGGKTTPGDFTGYAGGKTTPGDFTGYPGGETTPGAATEAPTQPPVITSASTEKPGFPTQPPPGYPEKPGLSTQPPPELTSILPEFPTHARPGVFTGYPTRQPEGTEATPQHPEATETPHEPEVTKLTPQQPGETEAPPQQPETTDTPHEPEGIKATPQQPAATEAIPQKSEATEAPPEQTEITEGPVTPGKPILPTLPSIAETESSTNPPATETFTSATTPETKSPAEIPITQSPEINTIPSEEPEKPIENANEDLKHPPHIHDIHVDCAKDMMTINLEFNREFNGIIYSKGYYNMPECRYVKENSGQTKYIFTVNLNQCGTEFINAFDTQSQSYLENILVLQNEAGIQEIWDTVRAVRCLWKGNLKESLSVALSVGMLSQELVTFSGDTAMAKLDILLGRGPLGQPANGLVKIGETMTLVVSVSGDPGFDLQVKDCRATDSTGGNTIPLTDDSGCVLKPKLFGAFQKTRNTGDTGASIIAYAYFNAFKFPDVMDLMIECNIELCKTDCEMCTDPNQKLEPRRRRRRDLYSYNQTLHDGVTMGKHLRIILPEDLDDRTIIDLGKNDGVCMSTQSFVFSTALLISLLATSCLFSAYMWLKTQQLKLIKK